MVPKIYRDLYALDIVRLAIFMIDFLLDISCLLIEFSSGVFLPKR